MNVNGENTRLWINERQGQNGSKWNDYSVSISKKLEDGNYINTYMKVRFSKAVKIPEQLENGTEMDFGGFLTVDNYTDRDGKEVKRPMVMITEASFNNQKLASPTEKYSQEHLAGFSAAEDDIPF